MKLGLILVAVVAVVAVAMTGQTAAQQGYDKVVMCYYGSWASYREGYGFFDVEDIDPFICTHLMYGFAGLDKEEYVIRVTDPYNDIERGGFLRFNRLKQYNPNLVTMLAIGGWGDGSMAYSEMVSTFERREKFIASCVEMVLEYGFDGLDLDWEYPGGRGDEEPGLPEDKQNFALLLREMRAEFDKHGLKMTAAVSASKHTIDNGYDVKVMAETLDFINIMSYDYHGWFPNHTYTGHNSPMYANDYENDVDHPGYLANTDFSVNYFIALGAHREKLLLGMGSYGRGFTLADESDNGLYAAAVDVCDPAKGGNRTDGIWSYSEYCEVMHNDGHLDEWTQVRDERTVAPYIYKGDQWLGFDDVYSIRYKSQYIVDNGLGGGMVWAIDLDDFHDFCGDGKFGLIGTIQEVLNGGPQTPPPGWTTPGPWVTTTPEPEASTE